MLDLILKYCGFAWFTLHLNDGCTWNLFNQQSNTKQRNYFYFSQLFHINVTVKWCKEIILIRSVKFDILNQIYMHNLVLIGIFYDSFIKTATLY